MWRYRASALAAAGLIAACNGILGISGDYHRVAGEAGAGATGGASGGTSGAGAGGAGTTGGSSGTGGRGGAVSGAGEAGETGEAGATGDGGEGGMGTTMGGSGGNGGAMGGAAGGGATGGAGGSAGGGGSSGTGGGPGVCGNGMLEGVEACDDRNVTAGDGCGATCSVEAGWTCPGGSSTARSVCNRSCNGMSGNACQGGDCCTSLVVTGGTLSQGPDQNDGQSFQSTVSDFRLDKYEVVVGRFRGFVAAYDAWRVNNPASGAGANPNVSGSGWNTAWTLPASASDLITRTQCSIYETWVDGTGNETLPINCVDWYAAFAFCIWDGGRLPTESEWEYAAAGGSSDRVYPWGASPVPSNVQDSTAAYASYNCLGDGSAAAACAATDVLPVGSKAAGRGRYGHDDLAGSEAEWVLDWQATYPSSASTNYAKVDTGTSRGVRGGSWFSSATNLTARYRATGNPSITRTAYTGVRCARNP